MPESILIVEDNSAIRRLLRLALVDAGYDTVEVTSGEEALAQLAARRFDAVLLDNGLGQLTGLDVLRAVREREETRTLPVLLVTGDDDVEHRVRGLQAGATDYVVKPFHLDELLARIQTHLRGRRAWVATLERQVRERSEVMRSLVELRPGETVEETAGSLCRQMKRLAGVAGAALAVFTADGLAVTLASDGSWPFPLTPGLPIRGDVAERLRREAARGPWIEAPLVRGTPAAGDTVPDAAACAPLAGRDGPSGMLALACREADAPGVLAAAIDFASAATALLAPVLAPGGDRERRRQRLDDVIRRKAFHPVFQPVVDLCDGSVVGYEALTRFDDGTRTLERFAEAAAVECGPRLELATLATALQSGGSLPTSAWLSVNVSPAFVLDTAALASALECATHQTVLELTEHDRVDDYDALRRAVHSLGPSVRLSVDDAGSGFASLRHVLALQPDFVKLDQLWVAGIETDPARQALVAGLVHFARTTGATVIAEGIESEADLAVLTDLGVGLGQGFLLGRPSRLAA